MENRIHRTGIKPTTIQVEMTGGTEEDILLALNKKDSIFSRIFPHPDVYEDRIAGLRGLLVNLALRVLWKYADDSTMSFSTVGEKYAEVAPEDVAGASLQTYTFDFCKRKDRARVVEWLNSD